MRMLDFSKYRKALNETLPIALKGYVAEVIGFLIYAHGPVASIGELCYISVDGEKVPAEVVGFKNDKTLLMPLGNFKGVRQGCEVRASGDFLNVKVGDELIGRVLDALGNPLDGSRAFNGENYPLENPPPHPLQRGRISKPLELGVKAIDGLITCAEGQRLGIFAGSGVGKSTLLGMIARNAKADINVISLLGERGREVREFLEKDLGEEGLKRSVVIVASSDQPALFRIKGAYTATAIAEYFRDKGKSVILMMDSVTRFAMALREVGLSIGEPPATRGYTPSVFAALPKLMERAGKSDKGSITALYTVLVDGDDMNEPISDAVRGILDGHIMLSRKLAALNHYPAIDVLNSVSRVMRDVVSEQHTMDAARFRSVLAIYNDAKDLIDVGAYVKGNNKKIDKAIEKIDAFNDFLLQEVEESFSFEDTQQKLLELCSDVTL